jgi:predicted metal-binding protein
MTTAFICVACRGPAGDDDRPGRSLFNAVSGRVIDPAIAVTPVECLSVCKRPCTIALAAHGKWTYVIGDLDPEASVDDILSMAVRYTQTPDGIVPWRERPQSFRKGVVARIPPLGFIQDKSR